MLRTFCPLVVENGGTSLGMYHPYGNRKTVRSRSNMRTSCLSGIYRRTSMYRIGHCTVLRRLRPYVIEIAGVDFGEHHPPTQSKLLVLTQISECFHRNGMHRGRVMSASALIRDSARWSLRPPVIALVSMYHPYNQKKWSFSSEYVYILVEVVSIDAH